jgi:aminoglycoside phosphotransferase family enzyme
MLKNELVANLEDFFTKAGPVALTETTKSWIFITPDRVFKLKKPVRDDLQDLTPLRSRHDNALTEIDLNRRLAPDLYLGAVRVGRTADGRLTFDQPGTETVDWLVKMRRLPEFLMLDAQIAGGVPKARLEESVDALVPLLLGFYRSAPPTRLTAVELMTVQEDQLGLARGVLLNPRFSAHYARITPVLDSLGERLPAMSDELEKRTRAGAIVECHGDLRPEHICLSDPPVIYDCMEFNRTLRLSDPYSEAVFLGMECAILGAEWVGPRLITALATGLGPLPDKALLRFYEACHAILRARLCFAHLLAPVPRTPEKWMPLGLRYLSVAERLLR